MNNAVFRKTRKHRDIKFVTTEKRWNYLVSEPDFHTTKFLKENVLATEKKKSTELLMNKLVFQDFQYQN